MIIPELDMLSEALKRRTQNIVNLAGVGHFLFNEFMVNHGLSQDTIFTKNITHDYSKSQHRFLYILTISK